MHDKNSEETSVRISVSRFQRYSKARAKKNKKTSDSQVAHFLCKTPSVAMAEKEGFVRSAMHDGIARKRASVFRCHDFKDIAKRRQKRIKKRATVKSLIFMQNAELCDGGERGI